MSGAVLMAIALAVTLATLAILVVAMARSIRDNRSPGRSVWREFGLGLLLMILFFGTWVAHAITQWQVYTDEQGALGESTAIGDFVAEFGQATLENWQSEFLQLFAFVVLAALYVHKGSAESKDGDEKIEASLRRIEEHLGTLPHEADLQDQRWQLPDTPMQHQDSHSG
jgi:hypothetical protein